MRSNLFLFTITTHYHPRSSLPILFLASHCSPTTSATHLPYRPLLLRLRKKTGRSIHARLNGCTAHCTFSVYYLPSCTVHCARSRFDPKHTTCYRHARSVGLTSSSRSFRKPQSWKDGTAFDLSRRPVALNAPTPHSSSKTRPQQLRSCTSRPTTFSLSKHKGKWNAKMEHVLHTIFDVTCDHEAALHLSLLKGHQTTVNVFDNGQRIRQRSTISHGSSRG